MTNRPRGVLYIGVTANLAGSEDAIARMKAMKAWQRAWKIELIERSNPQWLDLWDVVNA